MSTEHVKFQERGTRLWRMRARNFRGTPFLSDICKKGRNASGHSGKALTRRGTQAEHTTPPILSVIKFN